jgi:hypothetical protein
MSEQCPSVGEVVHYGTPIRPDGTQEYASVAHRAGTWHWPARRFGKAPEDPEPADVLPRCRYIPTDRSEMPELWCALPAGHPGAHRLEAIDDLPESTWRLRS